MNGLSEGNLILCIVDSITPHDIRTGLINLGIDAELLDRNFITADNDSLYFPFGTFDTESVLKSIRYFSAHAKQNGFSGFQFSGDMAWVIRNKVNTSQLLDFETKVIDYQKFTPCLAICEYDARKFDGAMIMDILAVHPVMLIRGQIVKNPYFIAPQEFMVNYHARQN